MAGKGASEFGFMTLPQTCSRYAAETIGSFSEPTILFRLSTTFQYRMAGDSATELDRLALLEATCGTWRLGENRNRMKYAMAVFDNVIQEIYEIHCWNPGGNRDYKNLESGSGHSYLWEFDGERCMNAEVRAAYLGKNVKHFSPMVLEVGLGIVIPTNPVE